MAGRAPFGWANSRVPASPRREYRCRLGVASRLTAAPQRHCKLRSINAVRRSQYALAAFAPTLQRKRVAGPRRMRSHSPRTPFMAFSVRVMRRANVQRAAPSDSSLGIRVENHQHRNQRRTIRDWANGRRVQHSIKWCSASRKLTLVAVAGKPDRAAFSLYYKRGWSSEGGRVARALACLFNAVDRADSH